MPCLICAAPKTVKSHLFPRALVHDIRDQDKHVWVASTEQWGKKFHQSGEIDDAILCRQHEAETADADKYGVSFCRNFSKDAERAFNGHGFWVPNPKPQKLVSFACGIVWRHVVSRHGREFGYSLGRHEPVLSATMFGQVTNGQEPLLVLGRVRTTIGGRTLPLAMPPHPIRYQQSRIWRFCIADFIFDLVVDSRKPSQEYQSLACNMKSPAAVIDFGEADVLSMPGTVELMRRMSGSPRK